tara:strand:+ start:46 stop:2817 length:2772 start_codon:yes stop_codon:yes gene_type:complete
MEDVDIFGYNLGGSVSQLIDDPTMSNVSQEPPLTAAQLAYFASQFAPGAGALDASGQMAGMPSSDADLVDLFGAENNPSMAENLGSGNYLDAALQGLGAAGDFAYAIPAVGPAIGATLKAPRAVQKTMKIATQAKMSRKDLTEKFRQEQEALGVKPATVKTRANTYQKKLETPAVFRRERLRAEGEIATFAPQSRIIQAPESLLGKVLVPVAGDRSLSIQGQGISSLVDVNGVPLSRAVPVQGGPDYMIINEGRGAGWASMEGIAQSKQNNITIAADETGLDPVGVYSAMARDGIDFSAPVATAMVAQIPAIGIPKSVIKEFDDAMRRGIGDQTKKNPTLKARPDWVGLESPDVFNQLLGEGGFPRKGAGQIRTALVSHMKKDMFTKQGFPVYEDVAKTITMPELADVPRGASGYAMFDAVPNASIFDEPIHQSYNKSIAGKYLGGLEQSLPPEIMFPDTFNMLSKSVNRAGELFPYEQQVGALERRHLFESMTDEKIDAMNRYMNKNYGTDYADGGSVDKIDIFGYNMGGSVSEMMGRESSLKLTPEQMAYIAAQLPVGAGTLDAAGQMPAMGSGDDIFADQNNLSLAQNLGEGNYLDAGFQGLGLVGDAASVMGPVGLGVGAALKLPRALQKMSRLDNAADSSGIASIDQMAAIAPDGIESVDAARLAAVRAGQRMTEAVHTPKVLQEGGVEGVREVEAALKSNQADLTTVDDMIDRALEVNDDFQQTVEEIAAGVGGTKAGKFITLKNGEQFDVEVKKPKSIADKIERKGLSPADFTDGVRTTVYIDTADQAQKVVDQVAAKYPTVDRGWQVIPESGYFDRKMNILVPDSQGRTIVAEIQVKTPEMAKASLLGHRWYEYSRKVEGKYKPEIPKTKLKLYNTALSEQKRLYSEASESVDPEILKQLVDKFMKGGAVAGLRR